jgi:hypothetical protein
LTNLGKENFFLLFFFGKNSTQKCKKFKVCVLKKKSRFIKKYNLYFQSFDKPWKRKLFSSLLFLAKIARRNAKNWRSVFKKKKVDS